MAYKIDLSVKKNYYADVIGSSYTDGTPTITDPFNVIYMDFDTPINIVAEYDYSTSSHRKHVITLTPPANSQLKILIISQFQGSTPTIVNQNYPYIFHYAIFCRTSAPEAKSTFHWHEVITGDSPDTIDSNIRPSSYVYTGSSYIYTSHGANAYDARNVSVSVSPNVLNVVTQPTLATAPRYGWSGDNYVKMLVYSIAHGVEPAEVDVDDPYDGIPDSGPDGGGGDFDDSSDPIDFPPLPAVSVADAGMCTIYKPSLANLQALNAYLWEDTSSGGINEKAFKENMKANIMECFMGLSLIPCIVPATNTKTLKIGNITTPYDYPVVDSQFVDVDMGTLTIKTGTGGTYLDYAPYTKAQIFLPFIGFNNIDIDDIMNKTLTLRYRFDVISGSCMAFLKCGSSVLYQFAGNCQLTIPLTGGDYRQIISAGISSVLHGVQTAAGVATTVAGVATGNPLMIGAGAASALNGSAGLASDTMNSKVNPTRSGVVSGNAGIMSYHYAYIVLTRPDVIKPKKQYKLMGYPSYIFKTCAELTGKGFTSFSELKMDSVTLTQSEKEELAGILKGGVYL